MIPKTASILPASLMEDLANARILMDTTNDSLGETIEGRTGARGLPFAVPVERGEEVRAGGTGGIDVVDVVDVADVADHMSEEGVSALMAIARRAEERRRRRHASGL